MIGPGIVVFIGILIAIFSTMDGKTREILKLVEQYISFHQNYANKFGDAETLEKPACGIYAHIDALYIASLSENERSFELQRRQMEKQLEQYRQALEQQKKLSEEIKEMRRELTR